MKIDFKVSRQEFFDYRDLIAWISGNPNIPCAISNADGFNFCLDITLPEVKEVKQLVQRLQAALILKNSCCDPRILVDSHIKLQKILEILES